mmetsp:Transcript_5443/g.10218  ORF Transcript_5443/g.10218 Transcript_5443/m.10218 type:complete len:104 (-) Transcript_5443:1186-1497(-)
MALKGLRLWLGASQAKVTARVKDCATALIADSTSGRPLDLTPAREEDQSLLRIRFRDNGPIVPRTRQGDQQRQAQEVDRPSHSFWMWLPTKRLEIQLGKHLLS